MIKKLLISQMTFAILLMYANSGFGQSPPLGATAGFALFTSVGAFTNVGASVITGDIGTNAGVLSGFPPGTVNGQIHLSDAVLLQAAADVDVAYDYLFGLPCGEVLTTTLGNNQILLPKVYCLGAASTLDGTLTLDAQGDPNALFIFQIDGALSTSIAANILLINGASANNVYWQINGGFELGDFSIFKGTLLVNGVITLSSGASLEGRGLSKSGAVNIAAISIVLPIPVNQLPIELLYFNGNYNHPYNTLSWSTATEKENQYFILERATDGDHFTEVAKITGAGNSSYKRDYTFSDNGFEKVINYYRLQHTDYDGSTQLYKIIAIDNSKSNHIIVRVIDVLGREVNNEYEGIRFIYYQDGTIEGRIGI